MNRHDPVVVDDRTTLDEGVASGPVVSGKEWCSWATIQPTSPATVCPRAYWPEAPAGPYRQR